MTTLSIALAISLTGCGLVGGGKQKPEKAPAEAPAEGAQPDGAAAPAAAAAEPEKPVDPLDAAIAEQATYVYNPIGKRDPFRSFLAAGTGRQEDVPRTPLQRYEVDQYKLVGIIWGIDRPRAMVEDPSGVGHVMEAGTYIGKNWGKVTQITADEVVVTEEYQTIDGELVVNPIHLTINSPDAKTAGPG